MATTETTTNTTRTTDWTPIDLCTGYISTVGAASAGVCFIPQQGDNFLTLTNNIHNQERRKTMKIFRVIIVNREKPYEIYVHQSVVAASREAAILKVSKHVPEHAEIEVIVHELGSFEPSEEK